MFIYFLLELTYISDQQGNPNKDWRYKSSKFCNQTSKIGIFYFH